jgi:hypothetical protein
LLFVGDKGGLLRTDNFRRAVKWAGAVRKAGLRLASISMTSDRETT